MQRPLKQAWIGALVSFSRWWCRRRCGRVGCCYLPAGNQVHPGADYAPSPGGQLCGREGRCEPPKGKNLIGAFYQPKLVLADVDTLRTLPERQFLTGMAEIIKYTAIFDEMFMQEVESYAGGAAPESVLMAWIQRSCQIKAQVVVADAKEAGYREILNFGHTVGHAVEKVSGYGEYTHGEAIAMGMVTAGILSYIKGYLQQEDCHRLIRVLEGWRLPTVLPDGLPLEEIVKACYRDKKVRLGQLRFVLLKSLGRAEAAKVVTEGELLRALEMQQGGWL